jgi:hypothetical protein
MFFSIGQKVVLKYTNDEGVVTEVHRDGMVMVRLDDTDMSIPVFEEDLLPLNQLPLHVSQDLPKKSQSEVPTFNVETQYDILQSIGLQLGFEAVMKYENVDKYNIYLINDTSSELIFIFKMILKEKTLLELDAKINAVSVSYLGELFYEELIDVPEIIIEVKEVTTAGIGDMLQKKIKLKPQNFFKHTITAPLLNKVVHHFVLFEHFTAPTKAAKTSKEDLKAYTQRIKKQVITASPKPKVGRLVQRNEIEEFASFNPEIDLHIENLTDKSSGMTNGEILKIQLLHFDHFMQKAYRLGVARVFIIHGVGKGKLRDAIATKLLQEYDIQTFKNEFHPKYGFGATEVIL